jgi:hypothetical protein
MRYNPLLCGFSLKIPEDNSVNDLDLIAAIA